MNPLLTIPLSLSTGFFAARIPAVPRTLPVFLNRAVIWVLLPSLTFVEMHQLAGEAAWEDLSRYSLPISMAWVQFALAGSLFVFLGKALSWKRETAGALILTAGLGNTSFIGYPVIQALYGDSGLKIAILTDQTGSFLVLSLLGVATAALFSEARESPLWIGKRVLRRLLTFPAVYALVLGILLRNLEIPNVVLSVLVPLGKSMASVALVSVGFQWNPSAFLNKSGAKGLGPGGLAVALGLVYKLLLAPALMLALYGALDARGLDLKVIVLESAMAPMVTAGIIAAEAGLDTRLIVSMIGLGIPLSFLTLPVWALLLKAF